MERRQFLGAAAVATTGTLPGATSFTTYSDGEETESSTTDELFGGAPEGLFFPPEVVKDSNASVTVDWGEHDWARAVIALDVTTGDFSMHVSMSSNRAREFLDELREAVEAAEEYETGGATDGVE